MSGQIESAVALSKEISFDEFRKVVLNDYRVAVESREASILGRKEVLTGKAKFGIFGDGKEVAQIALAKTFSPGDFRAGYYRDQTLMFALGLVSLREFFAQLYAHTDVSADPSSAGRQMNCHFATRLLNEDGSWKEQSLMLNSSSDISPTGCQMGRMLGLAYASKFYKENPALQSEKYSAFSQKGNEVVFGTIGDASTAEGIFFEAVNAAAVLQIPLVLSVWDDGYGISVPKKYQTAKESISKALAGFQVSKNAPGIEIMHVKGWDYKSLCTTYEEAVILSREKHVPVLVHVDEMTQPQGHSTSGSHERYKPKERLAWEKEYDCIAQMRLWITSTAIASGDELDNIEKEAKNNVAAARLEAWNARNVPIQYDLKEAIVYLTATAKNSRFRNDLENICKDLSVLDDPSYAEIHTAVAKALRLLRQETGTEKDELKSWFGKFLSDKTERYSSHLYSVSEFSPLKVNVVPPLYTPDAKQADGRQILRDNFDALLAKDPRILIFGEDVGHLGGVNQGLEGMQKKYGDLRVFDTGIREATIVGQGIGLALRGLRPIAEIQYLDYLLYALQIISDDLSTLHYRTRGGQKAPLIIGTRGHRLEGIWHSGSPMAGIIHLCRGVFVCVPRNMTKAAGFYNTLLQSDNPAILIEPLNAYRLKEKSPSNFGEFTEPLGIPEIIREGNDVTVVTYGPLCRLSLEAANQLEKLGISIEIIDVQTLLPFDRNHHISASLQKTNRILFIDEDVPGGTTAYMMQKVLEEQNGFAYLDCPPRTLAAKEHRPAYGSDGDFYSKPNTDDIIDAVYDLMHDSNPKKFPPL